MGERISGCPSARDSLRQARDRLGYGRAEARPSGSPVGELEWRRYERQCGGRGRDRDREGGEGAGAVRGAVLGGGGVRENRGGNPVVYLYGRAKARAERIALRGLDVSMSHSREYAVAMVVGESRDLEPGREGWRRKLLAILRERGLLRE